ncbi:MAG: acyl-CoA dehydrogenase, partial [Thermodesulfobacteriota bacterium]|nr:acyl-CoA dehydrogenase [Thermodesulfobacteriota bacterium]
QLMRDSRIFMIYEGTNGIQAMDLLGRKLGMKKGKLFKDFIDEIKKTIVAAKDVQGVEKITAKVEQSVEKLVDTAKILGARARSKEVLNAFSFAHPFLEVTGDVAMAWMLLWRASVAAPKLAKKAGSLEKEAVEAKAAKNKDAAYYAGQIKTAEFFINTILSSALGKMDAIVEGDSSVVDMPEASFGAK